MTFLELEKQYQAYKEELSETLNTLGAMCSNFTEDNPEYFEGIDYVNNPYELGYNETYQEHWIDLEDNSITILFSYEDSYDEICDSDSQISYPLHWVEAVFEGSESGLGTILHEIKDNILKHNNVEIARAKREAIYEALRYDLITKEFAEEALAELI
jgi:hypothetical protein